MTELADEEDYLLECLDVAVKAGEAPEKRRRKAMDTAAWDLLDKSWKGLLLVALDKEEIGNNDTSTQRYRGMRSRGRRSRGTTTNDWIEGMDGLVSSYAPPGYRLSAMLVQRARLGTEWKPAWDSELEKLRNSCSEGIHPVWPRLGREAPLLAEMQSYPEVSQSENAVSDSSEWILSARVDPSDRVALAEWLKMPMPFPLSADVKRGVQRSVASLESKGKFTGSTNAFEHLEGDAILIYVLVEIFTDGDGAEEMLSSLIEGGGAMATLAKDQLALLQLRSNQMEAWSDCHGAKGDDALSAAMRYESWINAPDGAELSSDEIQEGIELVKNPDDRRTLMWSLVAAQIQEGKYEAASQVLSKLNLTDSTRLPLVLRLIEAHDDEALIARLLGDVHRFDLKGVELMIQAENAPLEVRLKATTEAQIRDDFDWNQFEEMALDIYSESGDADRIGSILMKMENGAAKHPHRTLLVHHLLSGNANQELCKWALSARPMAIEALTKEPSGVLSDTSIELVKLLEGAPANLTSIGNRIGSNRKAFHSFKQTIRALGPGGDGLVPADRIDSLQNSINNSSLSGVELRLFCAVLDQLRFNQAIRLLDDHREQSTNSAISILNNMVGKNPSKRIVDSIRQVVLEHDSIAIPAFAEWHRLHATSPSWTQIILASIEEKDGKYLAAGRSLRRASTDLSFSFENRVRLARRALIAFAHAGKYSEAVEMLESQQALQSAMTGLFQLYLHVCDDAVRQQPDAARRRLLDWIADTEVVSEENVEGEVIERERTTYPSDELDLLYTYPNSRGLPKDMWQGRIRAAKRNLTSNRRSQRSQLEDRFQHLLDDGASVQEIEGVAGEAASLNPTQGMMMFERAMNSGQFSNNEMRALLRSQNGIFRLNEGALPIRVRRKLRHLTLKPLILVDTNLLIDAAREKIGLLLDEDGGIETNAQGSFHRTVLYKSTAGMVELMIPRAAEREFRNMIGNLGRVRSLFHDIWMNEIHWVEKVNEAALEKICTEVLAEYNTWRPPMETNQEDEIAAFEDKTIEFMLGHRKTYLEVVDSKTAHNTKSLSKRTKIGKDAIYPERGDRDIMREAAMLADSMHKGIGAILVASRDADFWIVRRSLEETFGFGVVRTARELSQWA